MNQLISTLAIHYGNYLIEKITSVKIGVNTSPEIWQPWTAYLFENERNRFRSLRSAWTVVSINSRQADPAYVPLDAISLESTQNISTDEHQQWILNPTQKATDFEQSAKAIGEKIAVQMQKDNFSNFDRFFYLMQKYASALPCTYGEDGVSLFQQWRMVAAVMALSKDGTPTGLPTELALVGLDLPGIQDTIYTIASRGAGKMVRGRSAFVQLLVNAIVDRLLLELGLCRANVIVNAGGNAILLAAWNESLAERLESIDLEINRLLFEGTSSRGFAGFQGDLSLALAWVKMPWSAVKYPIQSQHDPDLDRAVSHWQWHEKLLKDELRRTKDQPFRPLFDTEELYNRFFSADVVLSALHCAVCQRSDPDNKGSFKPLNDGQDQPGAGSGHICPQCDSFRELADSLGKEGEYLNRRPATAKAEESAVWQKALKAISAGYHYSLEKDVLADALTLALTPDKFPTPGVDGYWCMATTTPRVTVEEESKLRREGEMNSVRGNIRDNEQLANDSPSTFRRLGILKADVDDLGSLLVTGRNEYRSAAFTATLSESLTLFFGGWLDQICAQEPFKNQVYVLYAGGDDLLILGTWDRMPLLAKRIADDFERFTGHNPGVHLSAGVTVVDGKAPLYAAAKEADKKLRLAKRRTVAEKRVKNAIHFMGQIFAWREFDDVVAWKDEMVTLRTNNQVPAAFLMTLIEIYEQFIDDQKAVGDKRLGYSLRAKEGSYSHRNGEVETQHTIQFGPWLWMMMYRLKRLARRQQNDEETEETKNKANERLIEEWIQRMLSPDGIRKVATSARWAQLLTREKEGKLQETSNGYQN